jgi:hypothetical protein
MNTIYGPYKTATGRLIVILKATKITMSYPKYLVQKHLGRELTFTETVDHIDGNPLNNELSNLRIVSRDLNACLGAIGNTHALGYKQSKEQKRSGAKNGMAKLSVDQVTNFRLAYEKYSNKIIKNSVKAKIILDTGMTRKSVENMLNYKTYK